MVRDKVRLPELRPQLAQADVRPLAAELGVGEFTLRDIIEALGRPERDPRDDLPKPIFKKGVLKLEDLTAGMELKGTVLNVVDFGAFVDIGLKDSGLVHISQLANRYVKSPHDVVSVGDVVTVWVMGVDQERKRVSLTMVKPGTERHRGPQGRPRRGPASRATRTASARTAGRARAVAGPAAGAGRAARLGADLAAGRAPSVATLAEAPARRPDRDRGRRDRDRAPVPAVRAGPGRPRGRAARHDRPGPGPGPRGPDHCGPGGGRRPGRSRPGPRPRTGPAARPPALAPGPPPPPLSKDALAGNVPLRTFGQLKQLWEARVEEPENRGSARRRAAQPPAAASIARPPHEPARSLRSRRSPAAAPNPEHRNLRSKSWLQTPLRSEWSSAAWIAVPDRVGSAMTIRDLGRGLPIDAALDRPVRDRHPTAMRRAWTDGWTILTARLGQDPVDLHRLRTIDSSVRTSPRPCGRSPTGVAGPIDSRCRTLP